MRLTSNLCLLLGLCLASYNANAFDLDVRSSKANVLDFSLLIEHSSVTLENDESDAKFNLERIGILSFDAPISGPHFGLALGYAFSDIANDDVYEPISMDGYYIGVAVRGYVFRLENLSLQLSGHYLYQSVSGSEGQQEASLSWNEFSAKAIATFRVTKPLHIFVGSVWATIDATYREKGAIRFTDSFDNKNNTGYLAGIGYQLNRLESLSVHYQQAHTEGVVLRFRKLF